ncbi:unnamed protein product [Cochlearia groenlandica]
MSITKNNLIAFVLTIIIFTSFVHCSESSPGFGIQNDYEKCFDPAPCEKSGTQGCMEFCRDISLILYGQCTSTHCCCLSKNN